MTTVTPAGLRAGKVLTGWQRLVPVLATPALLVLMFGIGSARYRGFFSTQVVLNLFIDNAFLIVIAVGMTFVILTGGIDLSVGAMMALSAMVSAVLVQQHAWPAMLAITASLAIGTAAGLGMGAIIHYFEIQPFIVTLAGMFLARGLCYMISTDSISISNPVFVDAALTRIPLGGRNSITLSVVIALAVVALAVVVLHYTRLGRGVYAVGGNEQSAMLMGLPVARTKVAVYGISGFCSALGGILFTFYMLSGYSLHGVGLELDAIASVVIGGTLLTGGYGYVLGSLFGVLVLGVIQTIITFQGTLSSWWTKIFIGVLLFVFIVLQRVLGTRKA